MAEPVTPQSERGVAGVVERNVATLLERSRRAEAAPNIHGRIADRTTSFASSGWFLYLHLGVLSVWFVINREWTPIAPFDESYLLLGTITAIEAIVLATIVLIGQNRMAAAAEERAELNLQSSLLAEHEVTQILKLVAQLAEKLRIPAADNPDLEELKDDAPPEAVLDHIDEQRKKSDLKRR